MRQITIRGGPENMVILGTNGEGAIVAGLKMLYEHGTTEQAKEATNLLRLLGEPNFQATTWKDWEH